MNVLVQWTIPVREYVCSLRSFSEKLQTLSTEGIFLTALGSSVLSEIGLLKAKSANKNDFYEM